MVSSPALVAQRLGALLGLLGVILGAFAAHALKPHLVRLDTVDIWRTGVLYQFIHALALLAIGQGTSARLGPIICWVIGVVLFSGSLYYLAWDPTQHWAGPITPIGGLFMIIGWAWLLVILFRKSA